jgi:hypothetical protein
MGAGATLHGPPMFPGVYPLYTPMHRAAKRERVYPVTNSRRGPSGERLNARTGWRDGSVTQPFRSCANAPAGERRPKAGPA